MSSDHGSMIKIKDSCRSPNSTGASHLEYIFSNLPLGWLVPPAVFSALDQSQLMWVYILKLEFTPAA